MHMSPLATLSSEAHCSSETTSDVAMTGLYQPEDFRDNCGFGLISHMQGQASHHLLQTAIHSLSCMTHRGGIAADGKTGDGCGLLLAMPKNFFRAEAQKLGVTLPELFAVGTIFLNTDATLAQHAREILDLEIAKEGLTVAAWRIVPTNVDILGEIALRSLPAIQQIIVSAPEDLAEADFNRKLFLARRRAESQLTHDPLFYVTSLASTVISYKGLMMPEDIASFYLDLSDERLTSHIVVFHQRFSTNTAPLWKLAQPFRYLAHNGEINTIMGNRNWSVARTPKFENPLLPGLLDIDPLINRTGSDSSSLDNMLEILVGGGMDLFRALRMLVPPAWQNVETMDADLRAFYEFNSKHMEAWDGHAGLVIQDGRHAICMLDRNGLRPARWVITKNGYITLASEIGVWDYKPEDVVSKGRVGPGQILVADTLTGELLQTVDIDNRLKSTHPYKKWLREHALHVKTDDDLEESLQEFGLKGDALKSAQKMFLVSFEERDQIIRPLAESGQEAVGSMGDDTPMAVLSRQVRHVADFFRQQFAQVTNPPIDPLRESIVMSLETSLGREQNVFEQSPEHADRIIISSPVLSASKMHQLRTLSRPEYQMQTLDLNYPESEGLEAAIRRICAEAADAVRAGATLLNLSDRNIREGFLPANAMMVTGAVHHYLSAERLRTDANIIVETGLARDPHHFAVLIGFGASAVYPYLAYDVINELIAKGDLLGDPLYAQNNFRKGIDKGLLKILSKMGISTVASYRAGQLFEAIGLSRAVVDLCFKGVSSRIEGARFVDLENDQKKLAVLAWQTRKPIEQGGLLKFVFNKEYHAFNPDVINTLHTAVRTGKFEDYQQYADLVNKRPTATLRDLLGLNTTNSIELDEVEPIEAILPRFDSAGMSLGALSPEAHEAIAIAMNTIGGRSNSGEGGEDPARYGTIRNSKIKQVASGRFGVTPAYLSSAEVLQIKVAQGAKPGEGGQLPGGKVNALIARLRYSVPGVTLISPPPHHDIYSIEDLSQLIFDLKQVNPKALVSVKLVSGPRRDTERKSGFQTRDLPRFKSRIEAIERSYDEKVDKALVLNSLTKYVAQSQADRNANFDAAMGIKDGMSSSDLKALLDTMYAGSKLGDKVSRAAWLERQPDEFKKSDDSFIKAAVAMYAEGIKREEQDEELDGNIQQAYANYMKAKIAFMKSKGLAVYPDANSTLRVTFGKVAGRAYGADGTTWTAFTTLKGVAAKATGTGEFNAPEAQLAAIKAKDYGKYADPILKTVPVNFLATLDITGGNSGSAALNAKGEFIGLAFDGTLDSIISDWDFNTVNTRTIAVDLRYMLWEMKHVDHADNLLKEMGAE